MSSIRLHLKTAFKFGYNKSRRLPRDAPNQFCSAMDRHFEYLGIYDEAARYINSDDLHIDDFNLSHLVVARMDRHRQGAFIA